MNIKEQIQIIEDNLHEYGQCNITLEEFEFLKKQISAEVIEECFKQISERVNYWVSCANAVDKGSNEYKIFISLAKNFEELLEQLKEQK